MLMAVVPAAGTQDGEGGQGGVAVLADPTPVTAGEDFTPWNPAHANRLLPPGRARTVLRSTLEVYCEGLIADDRETLLLECPFSLGGLAKMERQVGRHAYQPLPQPGPCIRPPLASQLPHSEEGEVGALSTAWLHPL